MEIVTTIPFYNPSNPTMAPLVTAKVYKSLTIISTIFYSMVFLSAYLQLWLILILRHKLISTQTIYFLLCCLFTSLRIVLFSFYFRNIPSAENLQTFWYWLIMCLPTVLQYLIVLLITVFYFKTYIKSMGRSSKLTRKALIIILTCILLQGALSILPIWFRGCSDLSKIYKTCEVIITSIYVIMTDLLFLGTISTFVYVYKKFPNFPNAILIQEAKKITKTRSIIVSCACLFGVLAKLIYDVTALFGCSRYLNIKLPSPLLQSDFAMFNHKVKAYVVFGIVLFFWEIVPLISLMILFRVQFPHGFFKKHIMSRTSRTSLYSYSRSRSSSSNSSYTPRSKFISIPNYGSANAFINRTGPFARIPDQNNRQTPVSPLVNNSYTPNQANRFQQQLRSPGTSSSYNIQDENRKKLNIKNKLITNILPRIGRTSSQRCLDKYNRRHSEVDIKHQSSRLATANEE